MRFIALGLMFVVVAMVFVAIGLWNILLAFIVVMVVGMLLGVLTWALDRLL